MMLTLRLAAADGSLDEVRTLEQGTCTIGRGSENSWVLTDAERTISKQHCRIDRSGDNYVLTDTSTNGVFLNTAVQPLGRGHSHLLAPGDVIVIGPFRLTALLEEPPSVLPLPAPLTKPPPQDTMPYGGTALEAGSPIMPPPEAPWLDAIPGGKFGPSLRPAPQGWEAPPDPGTYAATGAVSPLGPLDDAPAAFSHESEHGDATATVMRLPAAQTVLPTDWNDLDPLDGAELAVLPVEAALAKSAAVEAPVATDVKLPLHEPQQAWRDTAAPTAPEPGVEAAQLVAAFLAGSGLSAEAMAGRPLEATFRELGELVRTTVEGVREILATRAMVKSELRADQTVIQASNNNPMKFAPDVQRCLVAMVGQPPAGFLPGPEAMRRSMEDIKRHELALIGALNTVLAEMTTQLEPEAIANHVRATAGVSTLLPYARDARCWSLYAERFAALQSSGAENTGGSLLAPMAVAYTKAVRRAG